MMTAIDYQKQVQVALIESSNYFVVIEADCVQYLIKNLATTPRKLDSSFNCMHVSKFFQLLRNFSGLI